MLAPYPDYFDPLDHLVPEKDLEAVVELARLARTRWEDQFPQGMRLGILPVAVEVGTWMGVTAWQLTAAGFTVFTVDHWQGNDADRLGEVAAKARRERGTDGPFETFCRNMGHCLFDSVFPLKGHSQLWSKVWRKDLPIDLLYIDADHRWPEVTRQIDTWSRFVRPGGIISGHDYGVYEGVTRAVEETGPFENPKGTSVWWREKGEEAGQLRQTE